MGNYYVKPRIYMEREGLREILKGVTRAFIVTDKFMHESGKVSYLTDVLDQMGIAYEIFSEVKPDPDIATVTKGIGLMTDFKPQALLALGGGSPIDCAKAINYLSAREGFSEKCKFVAIPTTSGTGTEVSRFSVISDPEKSAKYPLVADELLPDDAILDAELTKTVPPSITADTGIDVLTHAIEAFVSKNANDFTDAAAEKAIKLVRSNLLKAYKTPDDLNARQHMHHASCLAGMAFSNALLGIVHSMAHKTGAAFADYGAHIIHGAANAMYLPKVIAFNAKDEAAKERYGVIADFMKLGGETLDEKVVLLIKYLRGMNDDLNIPHCIKNYGADSYPTEQGFVPEEVFLERLPEIAANAILDACTGSNPRQPSQEEMEKLLKCCYYDTEVDF